MNTSTQRQKIIKLLQNAGSAGISSFAFTFEHKIKQCPTRIHELKKLGFNIISKPYKNSVIYVLSHDPKTTETLSTPVQQWQQDKEQMERLVSYQVNGRTYWDTPENVAKKRQGAFL